MRISVVDIISLGFTVSLSLGDNDRSKALKVWRHVERNVGFTLEMVIIKYHQRHKTWTGIHMKDQTLHGRTPGVFSVHLIVVITGLGSVHRSDCSPVSSQGTTASVRPSDYNQTNIVTTNRFLSEVGLSAGQETLLSDCAIETKHKHNDK